MSAPSASASASAATASCVSSSTACAKPSSLASTCTAAHSSAVEAPQSDDAWPTGRSFGVDQLIFVETDAVDSIAETRWIHRHLSAALSLERSGTAQQLQVEAHTDADANVKTVKLQSDKQNGNAASGTAAYSKLADSGSERPLLSYGVVAHAPVELPIERLARHVAELRETGAPLVGIRRLLQCDAPANDCLDSPMLRQSLEYLASLNLSFDVCVYRSQLARVCKLIERTPSVRFVLDHVGKPLHGGEAFSEWSIHMNALAQSDNVCCKLSPGFLSERSLQSGDYEKYLEATVDAFGPTRLIIGSDYFFSNDAVLPRQWFALIDQLLRKRKFSQKQIDDIFAHNAQRIYCMAGPK